MRIDVCKQLMYQTEKSFILFYDAGLTWADTYGKKSSKILKP